MKYLKPRGLSYSTYCPSCCPTCWNDPSSFIACAQTCLDVHLAALIDKNGDSLIDYQEFFPVCFSMIVEILSDKVRICPEAETMVARMFEYRPVVSDFCLKPRRAYSR